MMDNFAMIKKIEAQKSRIDDWADQGWRKDHKLNKLEKKDIYLTRK